MAEGIKTEINDVYVKSVVEKICSGKEARSVVPSAATLSEIMSLVQEDVLSCLRALCRANTLVVNKTLNSVAFKLRAKE